jgi:hypothetical protein
MKRYQMTMRLAALAGILAGLMALGSCELLGNLWGPEPVTTTTVPRGNFVGMHTMLTTNDVGANTDKHLKWVKALSGPGGWVKQTFAGFDRNKKDPTKFEWEFVKKCYDMELLPIIRVSGIYKDDLTGWLKPDTNTGNYPLSKGDYSLIANAIAEFVSKLPRRAERPLYIEVWNETNIGAHEWSNEAPDPVAYGYFLEAVVDAIHAIGDSRIKVLNGALSPGGNMAGIKKVDYLDYTRDMLTSSPDLAMKLDGWATHCYPGGNPPSENNHDKPALKSSMSIDSYTEELKILAEFGRSSIDVFITETAYSIGNVTAIKQNEYITAAFRDYWSKWPEVKAVCPFELYYEPKTEWTAFEWVNRDSGTKSDGSPLSPKPMYSSVRALEKLPPAVFPSMAGTQDYRMDSPAVPGNLLAGRPPVTSSSIEDYGWAKIQLTDAFKFVQGWTSDGTSGVQEWARFDFGTPQTFSQAILYPRGADKDMGKYFPVAFTLQYSTVPTPNTTTDWTSLYSYDYATHPDNPFTVAGSPGWRINEAHVCDFEPVTARHFRLLVTNKTNHGSGGYHVQLSELELFE